MMIKSIAPLVASAALLLVATPSVIPVSSITSDNVTKPPKTNTHTSDHNTRQTATTDSTGTVPDGTWPASTGTVLYNKTYVVKAGEIFDGKMKMYERSNVKCLGGESHNDTAVFIVEAGGTLKNAIIDALSIMGGSASSMTTVTNCGARYAEDKVVQHNVDGTVKIKEHAYPSLSEL
ncbi:unnamed protein product [Peronospora belbahrii]|uniref:Probable pectate lyase F n=1 Tax=Peronospora belbahrii TaxID=622444 RepID=A0AAU9KV21_9STRA|nr:unnamed protein product [Peronospora belbahrii]CAH0516678.1 unnamed protein product [Peronospora belbahrii]